MSRLLDDDTGTVHVLESVIIATIMVSAVAFVVTFEAPPSDTTPTRAPLAQRAEDALNILADTPVFGSDLGDNLLSLYLAECLQGNCTNITAKLDRLLPVGTSYALYVSNGFDTYPVLIERSPPGEAITAKRLLEPRWSYTFTSTGMQNVNNRTDPLLVYALPVFNSNVVSSGGSPLKVLVEGKKRSDGSNFFIEAFYTTVQANNSQWLQTPAVSLNFLVNKTVWEDQLPSYVPGAFWDRYRETMNASTGFPSDQSLRFDVELKETAGVEVPAGTLITVNIPRGWNATGWSNATWQVLTDTTDRNASYNGSDVVAKLLRPVRKEAVNFTFNATYHGDLLKYYPFRATLSKGALSEANLVVLADGWSEETQTFAPPVVYASVPNPMGANATTTWSLVVNIPYTPTSSIVASKQGVGSFSMRPNVDPDLDYTDPRASSVNAQPSPIDIRKITIAEQNGARIFAGVAPGALQDRGAWTNLGDRLVWTASGSGHLSTLGPLNLTFEVTGTGFDGRQDARSGITPPVTFDPWNGRLLHQTSPGLFRGTFLPNNSTGELYALNQTWMGYTPNPVDRSTPLEHEYDVDPVYRSTLLPGGWNYTINPLSPIHDGIYGSYVNVHKRNVPIGGQVVLTADVQSLLYALSQAGQSAGVNLTFYPPWSGNTHKPIWSQPNLDSGFVASDITAMTMLDLNADGYADPVVGTSQGRVFALDARTGQRLQGNAWQATVTEGTLSSVSAVLALGTLPFNGQTYIVVATDRYSPLTVLDPTLAVRWTWPKGFDATHLDTSRDFDGDGSRDIIVALADATVSVLKPTTTGTELVALAPTVANGVEGAYYRSAGIPSALVALDKIGEEKRRGFGVSLLSKPGPDVRISATGTNGLQPSTSPPKLVTKTPRAGMAFVDNATYTTAEYLGGPVISALAYGDANGDDRTDVILGSSAGYVTLLNGQRPAPPLSYFGLVPALQIVDADAPTITDAVIVTDDGGIYETHDRWNTIWCLNCDAAYTASHVDDKIRGVAMNDTMSLWAVGAAGVAYRSNGQIATGNPIVVPASPEATKLGQPYPLAALAFNYNDVHFRFGPSPIGDQGWIVADAPNAAMVAACQTALPPPIAIGPACDETPVLRTTNGGRSWTVLSSLDLSLVGPDGTSKVTKSLTRINFTSEQLGWISGEGGTLLRTQDGGAHWRGLTVKPLGDPAPTTYDLEDVACSPTPPTVCYLVGDGGTVYMTLDGTAAEPVWLNLTANVEAGVKGRPLWSVGVVNPTTAYIGTTNAILQTWNMGVNWTSLPMGYVPANVTRMNLFPDGTGYLWGGNRTMGAMFLAAEYERAATFELADVTGGALPAGAKIQKVSLLTVDSLPNGGAIQVQMSANGGASWADAPRTNEMILSQFQAAQLPVDIGAALYEKDWAGQTAQQGRDLRLRVDLTSFPDYPMQTPMLLDLLNFAVVYLDGADTRYAWFNYSLNAPLPLAATTTAVVDPVLGQIHLPTLPKLWTRNLTGEVNDLQTGFDLNGDGRNEVWAATGGILAENSPEYQQYAGTNPDTYVPDPTNPGSRLEDNRVYILDGATGAILRQTGKLPGNVREVRLADETGDGWPDYAYAATWDGTTRNGVVFVLDAGNLTPAALPGPLGSYHSLGGLEPTAFEVGRYESNSTVFAGTKGSKATVGSTNLSGEVRHIQAKHVRKLWTGLADERGTYYIAKDIPRNWFYGPYVVEVTVEWTDSVTRDQNGATVAHDVLQSARFYDYFVVTPPDALTSPPSPIYDVHLVAWFDDWR